MAWPVILLTVALYNGFIMFRQDNDCISTPKAIPNERNVDQFYQEYPSHMPASCHRPVPRRTLSLATTGLLVGLSCIALTGCMTEETTIHGFVPTEYTLDQIKEGSSREQVLLTLGSPSTTARFGNEVFYYISQKRKKTVAFMKPTPVEQTIVAVYFDDESRVERTVRYGLKDGKLFDFTNQITPTGGRDESFLGRMLGAIGPSLF